MRNLRSLIGIFLSIGLLTALAVSPASAQPRFDPLGLERAIEAQDQHTDVLLDIQGVVGTAVGHGAQSRAAIFVFTVEPGIVGIPAELDGVPVVAHVTGEIFALKHECGHKGPPCESEPEPDPNLTPADRWPRPVPIGVSTGHPDITAGTIGARVTDGIYVYALSNNHVYADQNNAAIGDNVLQPGSFDEGVDPDDAIGTLFNFESILFDGSNNTIDAAIARSSTGDLGNSTPSDGYGTPTSTTVSAVINAKLEKYGRTTGPTKAIVWAINSTVDVNYGLDAAVKPLMARLIGEIVSIGSGFFLCGYSVSLVLQVMGKGKNKSYNPVGLLFAGSSFFELTWLNPINLVLDTFGVTIDGE